MTFLLEMREAAKNCRDENKRIQLRSCADELAGWIECLRSDPTRQNMINLNGCWARAAWLLDAANQPDPSGHGGSMRDGALLQEAA